MRRRFLAALAVIASVAFTPPLHGQATGSVCTDGTTSTATGKGACSGHGGVNKKATAAAKAGTAVTCVDGATSKPGRGACTGHGGVKPTTAATASATPPATPAKKVTRSDSAGATAQCKDGSYSHAKSHVGACAKHGGVSKFLK